MTRSVKVTSPIPSLEEFGEALGLSKAKQRSLAPVFVERRTDGGYIVRRRGAERAAYVFPTQKQAIERARTLAPSRVFVERVRETEAVSGPDRWRKA